MTLGKRPIANTGNAVPNYN